MAQDSGGSVASQSSLEKQTQLNWKDNYRDRMSKIRGQEEVKHGKELALQGAEKGWW